MPQDILFLIGRILFGGYFLFSGFNHFTKFGMMKGYAQSKGVPLAGLAVVVSGSLIFFGGLGVLLGMYMAWSALAIALFLLPVTFWMHAFWKDADTAAKMADMLHFMKNLALLGAALMLFSLPGF